MQQMMQQSMAVQKAAAYLDILQRSESLRGALLVFLATLFLLGSVPFYPIYLVPLLAAACGVLAYRSPPFGLILATLLAFPAVLYQSAIFGWIFLLLLAIILFEAFENWMIVATLEILILAPSAFGGLPFAGWISVAGMAIGALYFGSRKSIAISLPSIFLILLLSSIWLADNTAYLPLNLELYHPGRPELQFARPAVELGAIASAALGAVQGFLSLDNLNLLWASLGWLAGNAILLVVSDSLVLQLIAWGIALYLVGFLPARIKWRRQFVASLALLAVLPFYYVLGMFYGIPLRLEFVGSIIFAIALLGGLEQFGIHISREEQIERADKMKAYGKFGMTDVSLSGEEKSMADVGGYEDVKEELRDAIIMPLEKKEIAYTYGIKPPAGILLFGPPGTGKTMLMRALAKELKYNFVEVRCSQILSQWVGESEKNVAEVFDNARKNAPTVLFFDEIDSIAKKRGGESLDPVAPRVLSELLQQIDGASKSKKTVMVIGATNLPNELDPAILRPGRLDKIIYMHLPDPTARTAILAVHMKKLPLAPDIDLDLLVRKTDRFSGADLKNIVVEAKRLAAKDATARGKVVPISMQHFLVVVSRMKPSVGLAQLETYEQFRLDFERRVGAVKEEKEAAAKETEVKWSDVAGLGDVKTALLEAIELPLLHEAEMKEFKVKPSKGILLFGPPGTGKTLIVRAAANELNASFQTISGAELMKKGYSQAVNVIKESFDRARENPPGIIFVDEIETFAPARGMGGSSEILGQFLTEMDGMKSKQGVVVIAATNKPQLMDPAIMRPGRFDKIFYIPPPDEPGRAEMFKIHLGSFASGIDLATLAAATPGFSGADIAEVCQSVKMKLLRTKLSGGSTKVSTQLVLDTVKTRRASITRSMLGEYDQFLEAYGERR